MEKNKLRLNQFLLIAGVVFAVLGVIFMLLGEDQAAHDTAPATATVTEYVEGTDSQGRMIVTVYYPVITYEVNGQKLTSQYSGHFDEQVYAIGESVAIKYNPDDPYEFILVGDEVDTGTKGTFAIALGGLMAVVGLVWLAVERLKGGKKK